MLIIIIIQHHTQGSSVTLSECSVFALYFDNCSFFSWGFILVWVWLRRNLTILLTHSTERWKMCTVCVWLFGMCMCIIQSLFWVNALDVDAAAAACCAPCAVVPKFQHINSWHRVNREVVDDWMLYLLFCVYCNHTNCCVAQAGCWYTPISA